MDERWAEFRRLMPVAERWAYFDHAAVAPLPQPAREAVCLWADSACEQGDADWKLWQQRIRSVRRRAADLIRAGEDEIALVANTTTGINLVADAFPWRDGDNVVTFQGEFPSNLLPWQQLARLGVEVREVPIGPAGEVSPDDVREMCDSQTRVVAVSWVDFVAGDARDLATLADIVHRRGGYLFVDGIQGLGALPLDVQRTPIDFLAADGHKWLLGPEGAGVCFMRREFVDILRPVGIGWNSVLGAGAFDRTDLPLLPSAARYEGGSYNVVGYVALEASLSLWERFTPAGIYRRIDDYCESLCERLLRAGATLISGRTPGERSGIIAFDWPGADLRTVRQQAQELGVILSVRGGHIRVAPHAYNDDADADRLLEFLDNLQTG